MVPLKEEGERNNTTMSMSAIEEGTVRKSSINDI